MKTRHTVALVAATILVSSATSATAAVKLITGAQIKDRSVRGIDLARGTVQLANLAPSARPKPATPTPPAPIVKPGVTGYEVVTVAWSETGYTTAYCPEGERPVGGGFDAARTPAGPNPSVYRSRPSVDGQGWEVGVRYGASAPLDTDTTAYVVCVAVAS